MCLELEKIEMLPADMRFAYNLGFKTTRHGHNQSENLSSGGVWNKKAKILPMADICSKYHKILCCFSKAYIYSNGKVVLSQLGRVACRHKTAGMFGSNI